MKDQQLNLVSKTLAGLEDILAGELTQLGAENIRIGKRAVEFTGSLELLYKVNLWSRTAINVMQNISNFDVNEQQDLYDGLRQIEWELYFDHSKTIAINAVIFNTVFDNSHFVSLRSKDAIADYFNEKYGVRPNIDTSDPDFKISIHLSRNKCKVSLDSSGQPLFKRNYRKYAGNAPINEVLAAGLIKLAGWNSKTPLIDPMCGSGTIPIEAALMAQNILPGYYRNHFGFQNWKNFDSGIFDNLKKEAASLKLSSPNAIIEGYDIDGSIIGTARKNIMRAGLLGTINLKRNDFFTYNPQIKNGILIINPPYGKRIRNDNIKDFYNKIGDTLKNKYKGYSAWIISQDDYPLKYIGLKPSKKIPVYNGPIECNFVKYNVFEGSLKNKLNASKKT